MKITKEFPALLKTMYDNCDDSLSLVILISDTTVEIDGGILNGKNSLILELILVQDCFISVMLILLVQN